MNRYEVVYIDYSTEYKTREYHANQLRDCLDQFNRDYKHEVDLACILEYENGRCNKIFKFKLSNDHLQYFIQEAKRKSSATNQHVQVVSMKPGRRRKEEPPVRPLVRPPVAPVRPRAKRGNEGGGKGGCLGIIILLAAGYVVYRFIL
ncbi:hypothetical protein [Paenibacillus sp. CCS19]|uniref:hypothetical protein n=1 Tax=Paenibacillus sp. CCS19 TaxID=3158387 RepID=UPI00295F3B7E|nr:hypothetical protein [Paenibacillus cellulosilyticus]